MKSELQWSICTHRQHWYKDRNRKCMRCQHAVLSRCNLMGVHQCSLNKRLAEEVIVVKFLFPTPWFGKDIRLKKIISTIFFSARNRYCYGLSGDYYYLWFYVVLCCINSKQCDCRLAGNIVQLVSKVSCIIWFVVLYGNAIDCGKLKQWWRHIDDKWIKSTPIPLRNNSE